MYKTKVITNVTEGDNQELHDLITINHRYKFDLYTHIKWDRSNPNMQIPYEWHCKIVSRNDWEVIYDDMCYPEYVESLLYDYVDTIKARKKWMTLEEYKNKYYPKSFPDDLLDNYLPF